MKAREIADDLLHCQDQVQRLLMVIRPTLRAQKVPADNPVWRQLAGVVALQVEQGELIAQAFTQIPAANDAVGQGDAA
jgi:hypothetical protein